MFKKTLPILTIVSLFILFFSGCPSGGGSSGNNPPYAINGPAVVDLTYRFDEQQSVPLSTDAPGADLDPDGDPVSFHFSYAGSNLSIDINSVTGVLLVNTNINGDYQETVIVWTEDDSGLKSADFTVTINVSPPT